MSSEIVFGIIDRVANWSENRIRLGCNVECAMQECYIREIGCPGVLITLVSKGKRKAKIKSFSMCLHGEGFVARMQEGFGESFGHETPSDPAYRAETLSLECFGLDKPAVPHGWVLEQDDIARFFFPAGIALGAQFATANCDDIFGRATTFDGEKIEFPIGDKVQAHFQPLLDLCIERNLECNLVTQISIQATSSKAPSAAMFDAIGKTNSGAISFEAAHPEPADFTRGE